jgi:endonuclease-3
MTTAKKKTTKPKLQPMHGDSPRWNDLDARLQNEIAARRAKPVLSARAAEISDILVREFPSAKCALYYTTPLELLVATILSAQCTDERVNMVTPALFKKYRSAKEFAASPPGELEKDIHSTGFFNNKAKAIREMSREVVERFDSVIPSSIEELTSLRGVARKTANVVRGNAFGLPAITVDTHFTRIMGRLGLTKETDPEKIEFDIAALLPPEVYSHFSHAIILHGRKTCKARKPLCGSCPIAELCPSREA